MVSRRKLLEEGRRRLEKEGIETAWLDGEVLLRHLLGESRSELYRDFDKAVPAFLLSKFRELVARRAAGTPIQYLTGSREFMGLELVVTPAVLIPRPETEILVETALELVAEMPPDLRIVDLGTGSGAIAVSLAHFLPQARVYALDRSGAALTVAWENARRHRVARRVTFCCGDLLAPLAGSALWGRVDLLVSNPPYIPTGELDYLPREVAGFEPIKALDGGPDGLTFYRRIGVQGGELLGPGGWLLLEVGAGQAGFVLELLAGTGGFDSLKALPDLAGIPRVVMARRKE